MRDFMNSDNSLPVLNLSRLTGWNPQEMWLLGASPTLSGDTPMGNVQYTLDQFVKAFAIQDPKDVVGIGSVDEASKLPDSTKPTNKAKVCADASGKVVPCGSESATTGGKSGISLRGILGLPPLPDDAAVLCSDCTEEQIAELKATGDIKPKSLSLTDASGLFNYLLIAGIIILAIAIYKLV